MILQELQRLSQPTAHQYQMSFKDERGRRFAGRRKALEYMIDQGTFSKDTIYYVRDGLLDEGWSYHQQLPPGWMFKQYNHKIEGVNTNILYHLVNISNKCFRNLISSIPVSQRNHLQIQGEDQERGRGTEAVQQGPQAPSGFQAGQQRGAAEDRGPGQ